MRAMTLLVATLLGTSAACEKADQNQIDMTTTAVEPPPVSPPAPAIGLPADTAASHAPAQPGVTPEPPAATH